MAAIQKFFNKIIGSLVRSLAQQSITEIDDGLTSSEAMSALCRQAIGEGCVLLENNGALPLGEKSVAVFGRCQIDTFYVGYGSGGDVRPPYRVSILDGLKKSGTNLDDAVVKTYEEWTEKHKPDNGFWGHWPMCYDEMSVTLEFVKSASERNETAVVVIGRAAGEDRENKAEKGSWFLTKAEKNLLTLTRRYFKKLCVIINAGSIMDVSEIKSLKADAVMYVWQGGQETGNGVADVLTGKISPCGKLTDTVARIEDYPSHANFGGKKFNNYAEDIYVGYRYFNTFGKDKIIYPFGYGLSYTDFDISVNDVKRITDTSITIDLKVKNIGNRAGKQVVQIYLGAPQGRLGKPEKVLAAYFKTQELAPNEEQEHSLTVELKDFASFDDTGATGYKSSFVLEKGTYRIYIGDNVLSAAEVQSVELDNTVLVKECSDVCSVKKPFKRMVNANGLKYENVPVSNYDLRAEILSSLPKERKSGGKSFKLQDVIDNKVTLNEFIAQLDENELEAITRGSLYSMGSPYGPNGNAGTLGANCKSLFDKGIPALSTNDGPSGVRLQAHSTLLPNGITLASTFNDELVEQLTYELGKEVIERNSNILLAPGLNIHRNPLCGRNFEYFSEDPYLSGKIAAAYIRGVQKSGASATPKHFACNNQEKHRSTNDSRVSQRALREIYLKGFEICVKEAKPDFIMTSYNLINGKYSYYRYDLVTTILRKEWGFDGCVMTDWWMRSGKSKLFKNVNDQALRVRAQTDVFMPGAANFGKYKGKIDGTLLRSLNSEDGITLGELQRSAKNVLNKCIKHLNNKTVKTLYADTNTKNKILREN